MKSHFIETMREMAHARHAIWVGMTQPVVSLLGGPTASERMKFWNQVTDAVYGPKRCQQKTENNEPR